MKIKLVIFGTGCFAELAYLYFKNDSDYSVEAFTRTKEDFSEESFMDLPVAPFSEVENHYPPSNYHLFIAVGYRCLNQIRAKFCTEAKTKGYNLATYISSKVPFMWNVKVGENCFIENCIFQPFSTVGNNTIIWGGSNIGHHSKIGSNVFLSPNVVTGGRIEIGDNSFIGMNASINAKINIASNCFVGAGAIIRKNTREWMMYKSGNGAPHKFDLKYFDLLAI